MRKILNITKALSDSNRVRALMMLKNGELCVCQIIEALELAPSTVSKHMSILRQADLVESRKCGRWMYYRLPGEDSNETVRNVLKWLEKNLEKDGTVQKDIKRLNHIVKIKKETLCKKMY
jgi:DNA-binding transcriptional ArsR family regulator